VQKDGAANKIKKNKTKLNQEQSSHAQMVANMELKSTHQNAIIIGLISLNIVLFYVLFTL